MIHAIIKYEYSDFRFKMLDRGEAGKERQGC